MAVEESGDWERRGLDRSSDVGRAHLKAEGCGAAADAFSGKRLALGWNALSTIT